MFYMLEPDPEAIRQHRDNQAAHQTSHYLELYSNLESLTAEQLDCVTMLLARTLDSAEFGHHIIGVLYGMKRYKHDICGCAPLSPVHKVSDHSDPEFMFKFGLDKVEDQADTPPKEDLPAVPDDDEPDFPEEGDQSAILKSMVNHRGETIDISLAEAMDRYKLEWHHESVPGEDREVVTLRCINCKLPYQSVQDRMLESPGVEGCMGCIQQAKTGGGDPWS